jgi:hypothetical protein
LGEIEKLFEEKPEITLPTEVSNDNLNDIYNEDDNSMYKTMTMKYTMTMTYKMKMIIRCTMSMAMTYTMKMIIQCTMTMTKSTPDKSK